MPTLYIVATPIGNLEDITLRALRVLRDVSLIAAEDTRVTKKLLQRYDIETPLTSYNEHNMFTKTPQILTKLRETDIALVSDAGTPSIRDPGKDLILAAINADIPVVSIPGPSAITTALAISVLPIDKFTFFGYLPKKSKERSDLIESVKAKKEVVIAFESPHRLQESLKDLRSILGKQRQIVVCRELTKMFEEVYRGTIGNAIDYFQQPRGEFTLLIAAATAEDSADLDFKTTSLATEEIIKLKSMGLSVRDAVDIITEKHGLTRRAIYSLWLDS